MRGRGHGGVAEVEDLRRRPWSRRLRHHLPAPATAPLVPGPGSFQRRSSPSGDRASAQARRRSGRRGTGSARSLQIGGMHSTRTKGEYSPSGSNPTHSVLNQTRDDEGPTHSNPPRPGNQTHAPYARSIDIARSVRVHHHRAPYVVMQPPRPAHMAPDDAAVRGMEEGDHAVALGYPLIVGDGNGRQQEPLGHPRHSEPHPAPAPAPARRRVHNSSPAPGDDCCSPCWTCFLVSMHDTSAFVVAGLLHHRRSRPGF
ncbi:uncharacterized protein LOC101755302 isoform X1 [Setaria italica]|uniref:uncharacterized protein LOC101755302 isoform X1 n=1 Tax=Setaria italica TaxID=4555 RepID=UPI000350D591|nr:uncharacterized protein LOC101755302 isoform X1 [Setaria italica]